jgi:hypothetical protein
VRGLRGGRLRLSERLFGLCGRLPLCGFVWKCYSKQVLRGEVRNNTCSAEYLENLSEANPGDSSQMPRPHALPFRKQSKYSSGYH